MKPGAAALLAGAALLCAAAGVAAEEAAPPAWRVELPEVVLAGVPFTLVVEQTGGAAVDSVSLAVARGRWLAEPALDHGAGAGAPRARGGPLPPRLALSGGRAELKGVSAHGGDAALRVGGPEGLTVAPRVLPGWLSVLPPLAAILLALWTRQVLLALMCGVWLGAWILHAWNPLVAFLRVGDRFLVGALADRGHAAIVLFSLLLGGMVGVLSRSGATEGIARALAVRVRGRRGAQTATGLLGLLIFFDDYANTLLVGNTMRPLTDRLRISREKLSYLVDSTAAPVTTLAVISTWVGFEIGLIQDALALQGSAESAYAFFLRSLPYGFYPILALVFLFLVAGTGRDFGPMLAAERRAAATGRLLRDGAQPAADVSALQCELPEAQRAHPGLALAPILLVVCVTVGGLGWDGWQKARAAGIATPSLREVLNAADSFAVLMWAALSGACASVLLARAARLFALRDAIEAWLAGARAMLIAMVILVLAWSLSAVCAALQTGPFLVDACRGVLSAHALPALSFLLAAVVSFATGTSWGTMAILMPIVFPLGAVLPPLAGLDAAHAAHIHLAAVSAVLAGAVFGDHCSPISDTTILSSMAAGSDHIDHVRTQLPYALVTAAAALLCGYLPAGLGIDPWWPLAGGAAALAALLACCGRRAEGQEAGG